EVHRVTDAEVQTLAAERRVDVRRIAREEDPAAAVARRLSRVVGPARGGADRGDRDVGPADPAQRGLQLVALDRSVALGRRTIELDGQDPPGDRTERQHPDRGAPPAERQKLLGVSELDEPLVPGDRRWCAGELEASMLADEAAASVAADEVAGGQPVLS